MNVDVMGNYEWVQRAPTLKVQPNLLWPVYNGFIVF